MPFIRADDAPRRIKLVYLGWKGFTLPFEWTYTQILLCFVLGNLGGLLALGLTYPLFGLWEGITNAIAFGFPGGVFAGVHLMKKVSHDQPIGYLIRTYWQLFTRQGRPAPDRPQRFDIAPIEITDLPIRPTGDAVRHDELDLSTTTTKEPVHVVSEDTREEASEEYLAAVRRTGARRAAI